MARHVLYLMSLAIMCAAIAVADEPKTTAEAKPQWQRLLVGDDAKKAADLQHRIDVTEEADQHDDAIAVHEELLALRTAVQGAGHWETVNERWELDAARKVAALPADQRAGWRIAVRGASDARQLEASGQYEKAEPLLLESLRWSEAVFGEKHISTANSYGSLAANLYNQKKYAEAQSLFEKVLDLRRDELGERHPHTATAYGWLGDNLAAIGKCELAQPMHRKALDVRLEQLGEKHPDTAESYSGLALDLFLQLKYIDAQPLLEKALDLRREMLGERHRVTATAYGNLAQILNAQGKFPEAQRLFEKALDLRRELIGEKHPDTAANYDELASNLDNQGKYAEAQPLHQKALDLRLEFVGEKHADTAKSYNNLAGNLEKRGKHVEAQPLYQKALEINRELHGEKHQNTASNYNNLAANLDAQGKVADAQPLYQKALDLHRELLGERHPRTALSYNNLAYNLERQGKYADAQLPFQKALEIERELLGENHTNTAAIYNNLAGNLYAQGKFADAQPFFQKAVDTYRRLFGEKHPHLATFYNNLAGNLQSQEKHADAQLFYEKALELRRELLGEKHPDTAYSYGQLGQHWRARGKYADAQPFDEKALTLHRELLGENHPNTADSYNGLACGYYAQGRYADAHSLFQKALDLYLALFGEQHPDAVTTYNNLAANLDTQGKYAEAQPLLVRAAGRYEAARLNVAGRGLGRAQFGITKSPYLWLAATQAHLAAPSHAWIAVESNLARGLLDETASRQSAPRAPDDQSGQSAVTARLNRLQPLIVQLVTKQSPSDEEILELRRLQHERRQFETELAELAVALSQRELATLAQVRAAIPADSALVLWVDVADRWDRLHEHWGCVLRPSGDPMWERLPGSGADKQWTGDDADLPRNLRAAVAGNASAAAITGLADKLYLQRIAPLAKHLDGVKRLFVVPVGAMAGVAVDVLTDKFTVSYVPSGTFLAKLKDRPAPSAGSLLALGDPVFPTSQPPSELPLPPGGLLITQVIPDGNAAQARLQPGDVLLKYAGGELTSVEELGKLVQVHSQDKSVPISIWREGEIADRELAPGKLGVVLDRQPAQAAIAGKRDADKMLLALARGGDWAELPGSAIEVARLTKFVGDEQATALTRSAASEQELEQLRASGKLAAFRYLHFATHGEPNNARSFESALILAQDQISTEIPVGGGKYFDGRLTANEVLETWKLDNAELVTLSACESALGLPGGGDGVLGFAQAFLLAGSRAVCLSLWKVDDTATALLMDRFYQNLLGKRAGLAKPMPKAAALAEAKRWLRNLSVDEAASLAADMTKGVARGKGEPALKVVLPAADPRAAAEDGDSPFSHPRYWAAFILIGDPD